MNVRVLDHYLDYYADLVRAGRLGGLRREDAEEVAQDALLLLHLKSETAEIRILPDDRVENRAGRTRSLRAWLRDTVGYLLRNRIRAELRRQFQSSPLDGETRSETTAFVERERDVVEFGRFVFSLLDEEEARLLRWHIIGLKSHEIGAHLGVCPVTVRVRLKRLLDRLRCDSRVLRRADALGACPGDARDRGAADESRDEGRDDPGPPGGTGTGQAGGSGADGNEPAPDDRPADPVESLLREFGTVCRRRGLDPWPFASERAPVPRLGAPRAPRAGWEPHARPRLAWLVPAGALVLALWWLGPGSPGELWQSRSPSEQRLETADPSPSRADAHAGGATSTRRKGREGTAPSAVDGVRGMVSVAFLPDMPPAIEVLRGGTRRDEGNATSAPLAAGGGILLADGAAIWSL